MLISYDSEGSIQVVRVRAVKSSGIVSIVMAAPSVRSARAEPEDTMDAVGGRVIRYSRVCREESRGLWERCGNGTRVGF